MRTISVVVWRYSDGSGNGIVRAFADEDDAIDMLNLMKSHGDTKQFSIESVLLADENQYVD